jgi:hypothetical protein
MSFWKFYFNLKYLFFHIINLLIKSEFFLLQQNKKKITYK